MLTAIWTATPEVEPALSTATLTWARGGSGTAGAVAVVDVAVPVVAVVVGAVVGVGRMITLRVRMLAGTDGVTVWGSVLERCCQPIQNPNSRQTIASAVVVSWPVVGRHDMSGRFIATGPGTRASPLMVPGDPVGQPSRRAPRVRRRDSW